MKYDHAVKFNGIYYPAGAEVPVEADNELKELEDAAKPAVEKEELIKKIKAMKRVELDEYAPTVGVSVEDDDTVETLKAKIIEVINK